MKTAAFLALFLATGSATSAPAFAAEKCDDAAAQIQTLALTYMRTLAASDRQGVSAKPELDTSYNQMQEILKSSQTDDNCYAQVADAFTTASLFPEDKQLYSILRAAGKIVFLKSGEMASALGAYDCVESKISLSTELNPLDLSITVSHEFDHLVRDKLTQNIASAFHSPDGSVDWGMYNLFDESLAIVKSATHLVTYHRNTVKETVEVQSTLSRKEKLRAFDRLSNSGQGVSNVEADAILAQLDHEETFSVVVKNSVQQDESTLFQQSGVMDQLWRLTPDGTDPLDEFFNDFFHGFTTKHDSAGQALQKQFYSAVHEAYFPNEALARHQLDQILGFARNLNFNEIPVLNASLMSQITPALLQSPSRVCNLYTDSFTKAKINHYIGFKFSEDGHVHPCMKLHDSL